MNLDTLFGYLIGRREAIVTIVRTRGAWLLGLLFVLSAGLAREYDGEDLLREPWHLLLPLAASLATSLLLYGLVVLLAWRRGGLAWPVGQGYLAFVALYWLTAPLAWLYAIPYERFLSPADAVRANLTTLAVVALWRVLLMIRAVSVVFRCHVAAAVMVVMLFADAVALVLLAIIPLPIFAIMGGIRLTESEKVLLDVSMFVRLGAIFTFPVWLIGTLSLFFFHRQAGGPWTPVAEFATRDERVGRPEWALGVATIVAGLLLLPLAQREQQLRRQVEVALKSGDVETGIALMSAHERGDFPPHWDPPPRIGYGEKTPPLVDVLEVVAARELSDWVAELFVQKLLGQEGGHPQNHDLFGPDSGVFPNPAKMNEAQLERYYGVLSKILEGQKIARAQRQRVEWALEDSSPDVPLTPRRKEWLTKLLELAGPDEK